MKKIFVLVLFCLICFNHLCSFAQNNNTATINLEYKKEIVNWCQSFEERNDGNQAMLIEKYQCIGASKKCFPKEYFPIALDFAKKLKYIYRTKDINALANIAPYPEVYIYNYKNKDFIEIKSKQQLLKLDKNILLKRSIFDDINKSYINWSWRGFEFSQAGILFFVENNKVTMLSIHLK